MVLKLVGGRCCESKGEDFPVSHRTATAATIRSFQPSVPSNKFDLTIKWKAIFEAGEGLLAKINQSTDERVIYFHGWRGFAVTPVFFMIKKLRALLKPRELYLHRFIYIDGSEWESRRSLQRKIAKELNIDNVVMDILDKQDEDDDFSRVGQASRDLIRNVSDMINKTMREHSYIICFLNGSGEELDLTNFGVPPFTRFLNNTMIWSFKRRSLTIQDGDPYPRLNDQLRYTHRFVKINNSSIRTSEFHNFLHGEAEGIVARHPCIQDINLKIVTDCSYYEMFLYCNFHITTGFAWMAHACNFWICDGIIKGDQTKKISNTLHSEIKWECNTSVLDGLCQNIMQNDPKAPFVVINGDTVYKKKPYKWVSLTSKNLEVQDQDMKIMMENASSLFVAFEKNTLAKLPDGLFKHCNNLSVLLLSCCAFNFASPPFLQCCRLRFLGVAHCTNDPTRKVEGCYPIVWGFLYSLCVLDIRYTYWDEILAEEKTDLMANLLELNMEGLKGWQYIGQLQTRLSYLERLRIINPIQEEKISDKITNNGFLDKTELEILDLSGNIDMKGTPANLSNTSKLEMLVLDGCDGLENIGELPSSLTSFSLDGYGPASAWTSTIELPPQSSRPQRPSNQYNKDVKISKISLRGCTQLSNLFLRGLSNLMELDLSGSALKVLDFESMVVDVPKLKRLYLLGCKHLRGIRWGSTKPRPELELMCIDTRSGTWAQPRPARYGQQHEFSSQTLHVHAVLADVRLIRSIGTLVNWKISFDIQHGPYLAVNGEAAQLAAAANDDEAVGRVQCRHCEASQYIDVHAEMGDTPAPPMDAFPKPPAGRLDRHIEITGGGHILESELLHRDDSGCCLGDVMRKYAKSLHIHDASISSSKTVSWWESLTWCRVERCSKLDSIFKLGAKSFCGMQVVWVSELAMARCLWSKGPFGSGVLRFENLRHLHLRSCPRLRYALPLRQHNSFGNLETIHVVRCGELRHVFELGENFGGIGVVKLSALTTIHLFDLPMLQGVFEPNISTVARRLETLRIRGCFGLRRLPAVGQMERRPTVEVEKDVWDALVWDAGVHPRSYKRPLHSRHYRNKRILRVSVLR